MGSCYPTGCTGRDPREEAAGQYLPAAFQEESPGEDTDRVAATHRQHRGKSTSAPARIPRHFLNLTMRTTQAQIAVHSLTMAFTDVIRPLLPPRNKATQLLLLQPFPSLHFVSTLFPEKKISLLDNTTNHNCMRGRKSLALTHSNVISPTRSERLG